MLQISEFALCSPRNTSRVQEEVLQLGEIMFSVFLFHPWFVNNNKKDLVFCSAVNLGQ